MNNIYKCITTRVRIELFSLVAMKFGYIWRPSLITNIYKWIKTWVRLELHFFAAKKSGFPLGPTGLGAHPAELLLPPAGTDTGA